MDKDHEIRLSGPFRVFDSSGRAWELSGMRIVDESYGIIDVFVDVAESAEGESLHEDALVIGQIMARLRWLGYAGPDFGLADAGLQDDRLIVLEAPEEFGMFAARLGWKNLAAVYAQQESDRENADPAFGPASDREVQTVFNDLMQRLMAK